MVLRFLGRLLLLLLALACGALALGAFASLNYGAPQWMRNFLSVPEGLLSAGISTQVPAFVRALIESLLASLLVYWAASWPRPVPKGPIQQPVGQPAPLPPDPAATRAEVARTKRPVGRP